MFMFMNGRFDCIVKLVDILGSNEKKVYNHVDNQTPRIALFVRSSVRNKISAASYTHAV